MRQSSELLVVRATDPSNHLDCFVPMGSILIIGHQRVGSLVSCDAVLPCLLCSPLVFRLRLYASTQEVPEGALRLFSSPSGACEGESSQTHLLGLKQRVGRIAQLHESAASMSVRRVAVNDSDQCLRWFIAAAAETSEGALGRVNPTGAVGMLFRAGRSPIGSSATNHRTKAFGLDVNVRSMSAASGRGFPRETASATGWSRSIAETEGKRGNGERGADDARRKEDGRNQETRGKRGSSKDDNTPPRSPRGFVSHR